MLYCAMLVVRQCKITKPSMSAVPCQLRRIRAWGNFSVFSVNLFILHMFKFGGIGGLQGGGEDRDVLI